MDIDKLRKIREEGKEPKEKPTPTIVKTIAQQIIKDFCEQVTAQEMQSALERWMPRSDDEFYMELFDDNYLGLCGGRDDFFYNFDFCFGFVNKGGSIFDFPVVEALTVNITEEQFKELLQYQNDSDGWSFEYYHQVFPEIAEECANHLRSLGVPVRKPKIFGEGFTVAFSLDELLNKE